MERDFQSTEAEIHAVERFLAHITGTVDKELLLRNAYLVTKNRMLRAQIRGRDRLTNKDRIKLATITKKLTRKTLESIASIVTPDTLLRWHRKLIAWKFDGSEQRMANQAVKEGPGKATNSLRNRAACVTRLKNVQTSVVKKSVAYSTSI